MMGKPETIGRRVLRLRVARRLSQRDMTGKGVSYSYVSLIENGTRVPSVKAIRLIAKKLAVDPHYLEFGVEHPDRVRARQLVEIARHWRRRAEFLERRLAAFEGQETSDMGTIAEVLHEQAIVAGQMTVMEAIEEAKASR